MKTNLSFEAQVLTTHDWVQATQEPVPTKVVQDDYDDGVQELYITYSDGSRSHQRRYWDGVTHDDYYKFTEQEPKPTAGERLAYIEQHSELREEEEIPPLEGTEHELNDDEAERQVAEVSLEDLAILSMELRHTLMEDLKAGLQGFGRLGATFQRYQASRNIKKELDFDLNKFERFAAKIQTKNHMELIDLRFYTPPGLQASYVEFFRTLLDCQQFAEDTLNETILPLKQWASVAYNEPDRLKSVRNNSNVKLIDPTRYSKQLGAQCSFTGLAQRPYGDCFERSKDLTDLIGLLRNLFGRYSYTTIERFDQQTKELAQVLTKLSDRISCLDDSKTSQDVANTLAEQIHQVAKQIEFYAVYNTVMRAALSALNQSRDHWEKHILR